MSCENLRTGAAEIYSRGITKQRGRATCRNPDWGCILQPKVAVLGYLGKLGAVRSNPEKGCGKGLGKKGTESR